MIKVYKTGNVYTRDQNKTLRIVGRLKSVRPLSFVVDTVKKEDLYQNKNGRNNSCINDPYINN